MLYVLQHVLVFGFVAITDWLYAFYIVAVQKRQSLRVAVLSGLFTAISAILAVQYVHDSYLICTAVLGGAFGAWLSIFQLQKKENKDEKDYSK